MSGSLDLIVGPMRGGKSTELYRRLNQHADLNLKVLLINSRIGERKESDGVRSSGSCSSHNGGFYGLHGKIDVVSGFSLKEFDGIVKDYDAIGIDEFQFFDDKEIANVVWSWVYNHDLFVTVAGLNGDSDQKLFGKISDLTRFCTSITHVTAICEDCLEEGKKIGKHIRTSAPYTIRRDLSRAKIEIGATGYICVCLKHLKIHHKSANNEKI